MQTRSDIADTGPGLRLPHGFVLAVLAVALIPAYGVFFSGDVGVLSRDFGTIYLSMLQQQGDALLDGEFMRWDPMQYGGTGFWCLPNTAPTYLPLILPVALFGNMAGLSMALLAHLLFGAFGTHVFVSRVSGSRFAGLVGGLAFLYSYDLQQLAFLLPAEVFALSWLPWVHLCLWKAGQRHGRWWVHAMTAGVLYAILPWVGGYITLLPGFVLISTVVMVFAAMRRPRVGELFHGLRVLAVFVLMFLPVAAGKLLTVYLWIDITNRADGLPEDYVMAGSLSWPEVLQWLMGEGRVSVGLVVGGLVALVMNRRSGPLLPFAIGLLLIMGMAQGSVYQVLYEVLPGFDRVREPRRAWVQAPPLIGIAAGLGVALLAARLRFAGSRRTLAAVLLLALFSADVMWERSYEVPKTTSLRQRIENNALHLELARRARTESRFRVKDYHKTRMHLKRSADLIRTTLRLESVEAVLGTISVTAYDRDLIKPSREAGPKLWGLLNTRYVTSHEPIPDAEAEGLEFVQRFESDPDPMHVGDDGPFLYRNTHELPRAFLADHTVLDLGGHPDQWAALLLSERWDPRSTLIVRADPGDLVDTDPGFFDRFALVLSYQDLEEFPSVAAAIDASTAPHFRASVNRDDEAGYVALQKALRPLSPIEALDDPPRTWGSLIMDLPANAGGRWLVLAETFAIYPGWSTEIDGRDVPHFIANGATTAIPLPAEAGTLEMFYAPPGYRVGMAATILGLLGWLVTLWRFGRASTWATPT